MASELENNTMNWLLMRIKIVRSGIWLVRLARTPIHGPFRGAPYIVKHSSSTLVYSRYVNRVTAYCCLIICYIASCNWSFGSLSLFP